MNRTGSTLLFAVALCALILPANAFVVVVSGNRLAYECFAMAKAGSTSQDAIATCTSALENEPLSLHDRAGTYVNRGAIEASQHQVDAAMADYNTSISMRADLADAYVDRAGAFILQSRFDDAMTDVNRGLSLGPTYPFVGYYNRAVAEQLMGKIKEAYFDYKKALELEPHFALAEERLKDFTVIRKTPDPAAPPG